MRYRQKKTRPVRDIERTQAMRENDDLREALDRLATRNNQLLQEKQQLHMDLKLRDYEIEKLLHDKIRIAIDLNRARWWIDYLEGHERPGWPRA